MASVEALRLGGEVGAVVVADRFSSVSTAGLTSAQIVALKADVLMIAIEDGLPLVDPFTGRVIGRMTCRDAA